MLGSALIVFRETLEAALVIGIIAAATAGVCGRTRQVWLGIGAGVAGSLVVASLTGRIAGLAGGMGQEITNACILGLSALMLASHNIWMARHGAQLARDARALGGQIASGARQMSALTLMIALCILREGAETVLFLHGLSAGGEDSIAHVLSGALLGLGLGAGAGYALYAGFLKIPARWFFSATSTLILVLAAAMMGQMARFLVQADLLPGLAEPLWDSSWLLTNTSPLGAALHTLVGYDATPLGMQVVFYAVTAALIYAGMRIFKPAPRSA